MQGQRVCLEAAVPGLLNAIVENANHSEDSFLQDPRHHGGLPRAAGERSSNRSLHIV